MQRLKLANIIVQSTINIKAQIDAMYSSLPPRALQAIDKRDA